MHISSTIDKPENVKQTRLVENSFRTISWMNQAKILSNLINILVKGKPKPKPKIQRSISSLKRKTLFLSLSFPFWIYLTNQTKPNSDCTNQIDWGKRKKKKKNLEELPQYQWPQLDRQGTVKEPKQIGQQSSSGGVSLNLFLSLDSSTFLSPLSVSISPLSFSFASKCIAQGFFHRLTSSEKHLWYSRLQTLGRSVKTLENHGYLYMYIREFPRQISCSNSFWGNH